MRIHKLYICALAMLLALAVGVPALAQVTFQGTGAPTMVYPA